MLLYVVVVVASRKAEEKNTRHVTSLFRPFHGSWSFFSRSLDDLLITIITLIQFKSITAQKLCLNDHLAPSLFVMGPQKTGTTSLASDLKRAFAEIATGRPLERDPPFLEREALFWR